MTRFTFLSALFFTALSFSAFAKEVQVKDHSYPRNLSAHGADWNLVGTHHYRYKVIFSVFTGAYYRQQDGTGERLVFTYTRNLKGDDLRKQAMKQLKATQSPEVLSRYESWTREIQAAYEDVSAEDSYALTLVPGRGIWLDLNGETVYHSGNAEFGDWYLDIWLGDPPIDEDLKKALMQP